MTWAGMNHRLSAFFSSFLSQFAGTPKGGEVCVSQIFGSSSLIPWVVPPPRIPVTNEGLGCDFLLKMVHNPGGFPGILGKGGTYINLYPKQAQIWQIW